MKQRQWPWAPVVWLVLMLSALPVVAQTVEDIRAVMKGQLAVFDATATEYEALLHFEVPDEAAYQQWLDEKGSGKFSLAPDIRINVVRDGRRYLAAATQENGAEVRYAHDGALYRRHLVTEEYGSIEAGFGDGGRYRSIRDDVPNLTVERGLGPRETRAWVGNPSLFATEIERGEQGVVVRLKPTEEAIAQGFRFETFEMTLDEARNYAVIRSSAEFEGGAALVYEAENFVELAGSKGSIWVPRKMSSTMFSQVGGREKVPLQTMTLTVQQVELDKAYPDQTFTFNYPDGTRVHDAATDTVYVVGRVEMDNKRIGDLAKEARAVIGADLSPPAQSGAENGPAGLVVTEGPLEAAASSKKTPSVPLLLLVLGGLTTVAGLALIKRLPKQNRSTTAKSSERDAA